MVVLMSRGPPAPRDSALGVEYSATTGIRSKFFPSCSPDSRGKSSLETQLLRKDLWSSIFPLNYQIVQLESFPSPNCQKMASNTPASAEVGITAPTSNSTKQVVVCVL